MSAFSRIRRLRRIPNFVGAPMQKYTGFRPEGVSCVLRGLGQASGELRFPVLAVGSAIFFFSAALAARGEDNFDGPAVIKVNDPITKGFGHSKGEKLVLNVKPAPVGEGAPNPQPGAETQPKPRAIRVWAKLGKDEKTGYSLLGLMDGSADTKAPGPDSDSLQCVVQWSKKSDPKATFTPDTNALPGRSGAAIRAHAATWHDAGTDPPSVFWETPIPDGANQVEIVAVYTDLMDDTNAARCRRNNTDFDGNKIYGDVPGVIGSWHGDLDKPVAEWFTINSADLVGNQKPKYSDPPTWADIKSMTKNAKDVVNNRTGYTLLERPASLKALRDNNNETKDTIEAALSAAALNNEINKDYDSGFDIQLTR
jgi:hypothetical protein